MTTSQASVAEAATLGGQMPPSAGNKRPTPPPPTKPPHLLTPSWRTPLSALLEALHLAITSATRAVHPAALP